MNLSKVHHIAIIVSDYEAAKDFYVNKLGFSVIRENYRPERKDWKLSRYGSCSSRPVCMNLKWRRRCKLPFKDTVKHKTTKPPYSQLQTL